jgi:hypothetical protein
MTCTNCGQPMAASDVFCGKCGAHAAATASAIIAERGLAQDVPTAARPMAESTITQSLESVGASPFDADAVYLQKTLRHEPMELGLDDSVSLRTLFIMVVRAYIAWAIVFIVLGFFGIIELANHSGPDLLIVAFVAGVVVFWGMLLGSKVTEPIGEWRTLLPDRAGQAACYYNMIRVVLKRRDLPISVAPRVQSIQLAVHGNPVKRTIVLSESEYRTYVTVFPYGTSLYVGWQMWRRRSGVQLIRRALIDRVTAANLVTAMLRTDRARAVREAVHLACREALYATPDESLWAQAQQLPLPPVEQESALLSPQPASPVLPPPSISIPAASSAPAPAASATPALPQTAAPMEESYE